MVKQKTIKKEISLTGVGLHTGKEVKMTFKPAPVNNGFTFVRVDLEGHPIVEADANYVVNTQRGTNLEKLGVKIQTPEHVLAALVGCDLDNVIIELSASELPIMDGSSKFFVEAIEKAGGFTTDTLAEDCDLTIRILRNDYHIINCIEAVAVTEAPESLKEFMKQRFRWSYGIMQAFWKNRDACFNPRYKGLGMVALPNILLFQIVLPIFAPLADLVLILSLFWNYNDPDSLHKILIYYIAFMLVDMLVSVIAFIFEKEKLTKLIWLIPQRFVYRQLMYVILFRALRRAIKGESQSWGVLTRTGNVATVK